MIEPVYHSEVDGWLLTASRVTTGAALVAMAGVLYSGVSASSLLSMLILITVAAFPWWILNTTDYTFTQRSLEIRSGPFHWSVPLGEITRIELTRDATSSPALSLDRLRIQYQSGAQVMISPANRKDFFAELRRRGVRVAIDR